MEENIDAEWHLRLCNNSDDDDEHEQAEVHTEYIYFILRIEYLFWILGNNKLSVG